MIHPIGIHKALVMELWGIPIATDHWDIAERLKTATTGSPLPPRNRSGRVSGPRREQVPLGT